MLPSGLSLSFLSITPGDTFRLLLFAAVTEIPVQTSRGGKEVIPAIPAPPRGCGDFPLRLLRAPFSHVKGIAFSQLETKTGFVTVGPCPNLPVGKIPISQEKESPHPIPSHPIGHSPLQGARETLPVAPSLPPRPPR